jgi:hypothetical protein
MVVAIMVAIAIVHLLVAVALALAPVIATVPTLMGVELIAMSVIRDIATTTKKWEHLNFVRAKHDRSKSLTITNKLSAVMLRPYEYICKTEMLPM